MLWVKTHYLCGVRGEGWESSARALSKIIVEYSKMIGDSIEKFQEYLARAMIAGQPNMVLVFATSIVEWLLPVTINGKGTCTYPEACYDVLMDILSHPVFL